MGVAVIPMFSAVITYVLPSSRPVTFVKVPLTAPGVGSGVTGVSGVSGVSPPSPAPGTSVTSPFTT